MREKEAAAKGQDLHDDTLSQYTIVIGTVFTLSGVTILPKAPPHGTVYWIG